MARIPRKLAGIGAGDIPNAAAFDGYIGPAREITVDPVRGILSLHDGVQAGGKVFKSVDQILNEAFGISDVVDFAHLSYLNDNAVVPHNGVMFVRDRSANITGLLTGAGWRPYGAAEPSHFGVLTGADDTEVLQAWLNFGGQLLLTGVCGFNAPLNISIGDTVIIGGGGKILWTGAYYALNGLTLDGDNIVLQGIEIDGADLLGKGVLINGAGCDVVQCHIHNMRSTTGTSAGIHAFSRTGGRIALNHIHHIHSVGNGTAGDANGAARAVLIQGTDDLLSPYDVYQNDIHDITGEEGDGIQILLLGGTTFRSALKTRIAHNRIRGCSKRCVKVQAKDMIVEGNAVLLDMAGAYSAMDIINSSRCAVSDNDIEVTATDGRGIQYSSFDVPTFGRSSDAEIRRNRVKMPAGAAHIAIYAFLLDRPVVSGNRVTGGRIIIDNCVASVTNDNSGHDVELSSSDGLISIRNNCLSATVIGNTLFSGEVYTCVRVDAAGSFVSGNRNHSTVGNSASVVFMTVGGCVITSNINAKPAVPVVRYESGITEQMQVLVANNMEMA